MSIHHHNKPLLLHPTDFSDGSEIAFEHALSLALVKRSGLSILHVGDPGDDIHWENFPGVRDTLTKWGLLDCDAKRTDVYKRLGVTVEKVETHTRSVVDGITQFGNIHRHGTDILVLATEGREGLPRWLERSKAEQIARDVRLPALFVPKKSPMVDQTNGELNLSNILLPIDHSPNPQFSIDYAVDMLKELNITDCKINLLHVGEHENFPSVKLPLSEGVSIDKISVAGDIVPCILSTAHAKNSELIIMVTHGHDGFLDVLRGSASERVLREASCPVLTLPVQ